MPIVRITGLPVPPSNYDLSPVPGPVNMPRELAKAEL